MRQSNEQTDSVERLLSTVDTAIAEQKPAPSDKLRTDIETLRDDIVRLCREQRVEEAQRAAKLCLSLIHQGEAVKE
jgi:hypothetical protein